MSKQSVSYFDEMNIMQSDKDERVATCDNLSGRITDTFRWFKEDKPTLSQFERKLLKDFIFWAFMIGYLNSLELILLEEYLNIYGIHSKDIVRDKQSNVPADRTEAQIKYESIRNDVQMIVENTQKHIKDKYYLSDKRAFNIAKDQTNQKINYLNHTKGAASKQNRFHKWVSMGDKHTRDSHSATDGQIKPINEPFEVNGYLMMYPMDDSLGAPIEEIAGCRCSEEVF